MKMASGVVWGFMLLLSSSMISTSMAAYPNCSFPAIFSFGDSLTDTGNAIAAFPDQFLFAEVDPNGLQWPLHAADRLCDGRLLVDFMAFGIHRRPNYAILRGIAADFTYGANCAATGATARNNTFWVPNAGFSTPFSLNWQVKWLERFNVRLQFYYTQTIVTQSLPPANAMNSSFYMVYSGFQDYFFPLYYQKMTVTQLLAIVPSVVDAILKAVEELYAFGAQNILVVNLYPIGCAPALLSLATEPAYKYDGYGCLSGPNAVIALHNKLLGEGVEKLRAKVTNGTLYYGDLHGVYTDMLKAPAKYGVTSTLAACCGYGGKYNFNSAVTCSHLGSFDNKPLNLTAFPPCANASTHLSWDGIHTSQTVNRNVATAFLTGKHITPLGGFKCAPDFSNFFTPY